MKPYFTVFWLIFSSTGISQNITFNDIGLKNYLIQELCVDTANTFWGNGHVDVDLNNDNEIQIEEAEQVTQLMVEDFGDHYNILSVQDISHFKNLRWLKLVHVDSVYEISHLGLDSLKHLWIGANYNLKIIDISDLQALTEALRIEDIDTLDYLNIQNGSIPELFSLFYSEHIHYACVDSIAAEYNEVAWRMIENLPEFENCSSSTTQVEAVENEVFNLYPNPTNGILKIKSHSEFRRLNVFNIDGRMVGSIKKSVNEIDLTNLKTGLYFVEILIKDKRYTQIISKK